MVRMKGHENERVRKRERGEVFMNIYMLMNCSLHTL